MLMKATVLGKSPKKVTSTHQSTPRIGSNQALVYLMKGSSYDFVLRRTAGKEPRVSIFITTQLHLFNCRQRSPSSIVIGGR
jgi:hypothetical protein